MYVETKIAFANNTFTVSPQDGVTMIIFDLNSLDKQ